MPCFGIEIIADFLGDGIQLLAFALQIILKFLFFIGIHFQLLILRTVECGKVCFFRALFSVTTRGFCTDRITTKTIEALFIARKRGNARLQ